MEFIELPTNAGKVRLQRSRTLFLFFVFAGRNFCLAGHRDGTQAFVVGRGRRRRLSFSGPPTPLIVMSQNDG